MWVKKTDGIERRKWFTAKPPLSKYPSKNTLLYALLGFNVTHSIPCPINNIAKNFIDTLDKKSINFIRFYFAEYNETYGSDVPPGLNKDLTIIIAPAFSETNDREDYYNVTPNGEINKITKDEKIGWIKDFENTILPELNKSISDLKIPDNLDPHDKNYYDTKSCCYPLSYFIEFLDTEEKYQEAKGNPMTGIEIDFCSYTNKGILKSDNQYHFRNRLILQFEYTRKHGSNNYEVFYIDDQNENRKPQPYDPKTKIYLNPDLLTADNGTLCPANCPQ